VPLIPAQDHPLWVHALIFLVAAVCVWIAGTRLTRNLDIIAEKTGMDEAFAGMLFLGIITSLPEIANVVTASVTGNPQLAVNNLLGSASINVVLLAATDAAIGQEAITSAVFNPATMMMAALCMLVLAAVAIVATTGDWAVLGVGVGALVLCALSIGAFWLAAGYGARAPWRVEHGANQRVQHDRRGAGAPVSLRLLVVTTAVLAAIILFAGFALSQTGDAIATQTGIGSALVGFALIGTATSMPELSTIVEAVRLRRYEMAFGQVLGTNFINLSLILVADVFFVGGPVISELGAFETVSALLGIILIGIFLVGILERRNPRVLNMGYDSLAILVVFAGGLGLLYLIR
jgi:cation:H+ antiporter